MTEACQPSGPTAAPDEIDRWHRALPSEDAAICAVLRAAIEAELTEAESKIWHAHPVWFLEGNPVVGYSKLKDCVRLLFWSGQSFAAGGLTATGKFKSSERRFQRCEEVDEERLAEWLREAREIQWDYKNIVRRKGRLERLR